MSPARHWLACVAFVAVTEASATIKVELEGVDGDERKNVEAFLSIQRERDEKDLSEARVHRLHERAPDEIREALSPFGRYRVQVEGELAGQPDGSWRARYRIDPGPPVPIGTVDVRIVGEGAGSEGPKIDLAPGQPFTHAAWEAAKTSLKRYAREHGYLDARFTEAGVEVDPEANRADVRLHLDTGPRFYFGDIRFVQSEGQDFDPAFLQRFVDVAPGTPFTDEALLGLQGALMNTDYFSQVEIQPRVDEVAEQRLPVEVRVERNPPNRYRIGFGYATDTGPRMIFDWTRRYVGREGHSADAQLLVSQAIQRLEAGYRIPLGDPRREYASLRASIEHYDTDARKGSVATVRADHHAFFGDWQRILAVDYEYEKPQDASETESASEYYNLIPNATLIWKHLDDPIYTRNGARIDFKLLGAYEGLLSSSTFLQGYVRAKAIHSPAEEWRLIARGEVGATWADSVFDIPPSRRFYAGGDNSVRGWAYEDLSPEDADGEKTGGRNLLTASLEAERHVTGKWWAAAFVDAGNAFDDWGDPGIVGSAGVGVRWLTPVGPLRLDVAVPLDDAPDSFRIHLVFGPDL